MHRHRVADFPVVALPVVHLKTASTFEDVKERLVLVTVAFVALARLQCDEMHVQALAPKRLIAWLHDVPAFARARAELGADQSRHAGAELALLLGQRVALAFNSAHEDTRHLVPLGVFPDRWCMPVAHAVATLLGLAHGTELEVAVAHRASVWLVDPREFWLGRGTNGLGQRLCVSQDVILRS